MKSNINGIILSDYKQDNSLVFVDFSAYNSLVSILEPTLSIIRPYFSFPINVPYNPNGLTNLTNIDLQYDTIQSQIPCGLYKITQSICPSDKLFNTFYYVHLGGAKQNVANLRCQNKITEAMALDDKINTLEALAYCKNETKILAILKTLNCSQTQNCDASINVSPLQTPVQALRYNNTNTPCQNC